MVSERTILARKHILYSLLLKVVSIGMTLVLVPMTLHYLDNAQYGIWLTLSSIVSWVAFFDIGLTHGFRNKFTEMVALGNYEKARQYVSTAYASLTIIFLPVIILCCVLSFMVDWTDLLNIEGNLLELQLTFAIMLLFFCVNLVLSVSTIMLIADQRPAYCSLIVIIGQALSLLAIFLLTRFSQSSLVYLALAMSSIPTIVVAIFTFVLFKSSRYKKFCPRIKSVDFSLNNDIIGLGGKFFFITIFMLLIFQLINVIISRIEGANAVTEYNIAYKYFNSLFMFAMIVLQPFWSSFTDAYTKKDFVWMKRILNRLEIFGWLSLPMLICMVLFSEFVYDIWLNGEVKIDLTLTLAVAFYVFCCIMANVYMVVINGTGKVLMQLIIYGVSAIISVPLMYVLCLLYGCSAMLLVPSVVYIAQALSGKIQITKIIEQTDTGLWAK